MYIDMNEMRNDPNWLGWKAELRQRWDEADWEEREDMAECIVRRCGGYGPGARTSGIPATTLREYEYRYLHGWSPEWSRSYFVDLGLQIDAYEAGLA